MNNTYQKSIYWHNLIGLFVGFSLSQSGSSYLVKYAQRRNEKTKQKHIKYQKIHIPRWDIKIPSPTPPPPYPPSPHVLKVILIYVYKHKYLYLKCAIFKCYLKPIALSLTVYMYIGAPKIAPATIACSSRIINPTKNSLGLSFCFRVYIT